MPPGLNLSDRRATKWLIARWTARPPRSPAVPSRALAAIPPDAANPNPVGTPRRGFWYLANFRHGTRLVSPKFRGGGSGLGGLAAEPFAIGWPVLNSARAWALADALAKRPAEEILFDWFRSGRLVGELSVLIKRRHPEVQARIDLVYQKHHLATLGKRRPDPAAHDE